MSARQNKKRKGRNNVNNRERTVTTFTEDPNTSFLVPLPSEEPALSSPFSVASTSTTNNPNNSFQNFGMSYNFHAHGPNSQPQQAQQQQQQQQQQHQQQQFFSPQVILPPGKNDLEVLENLKSIIKEGQHEFYRAIPQPAALASLYLGPTSSQVLPHPEQLPADYYNNQSGYDNSSDDQILPYSSDSTRRPPDPPVVKKSSSTANNPDPTPPPGGPKPGKKVEAPLQKPESKMSTGPDNADVNPRDGALSGDHRDSSKNDTSRPLGDRPGEYTTRPSVDSSAPKSTYDGKDDIRRDTLRDSPLDDRRVRFDAERRPLDSRPNGNDPRPPPRDQASLDKERDREREREREREWGRDRDRDRPQYGGRSYGRSHAPRPPPEQRHYEPRYPFDNIPPRRYDSKDDLDVDRRPPLRPDDRGPRPSLDDRRPPVDDRESRSMVVDDRDRPSRVTLDDRPTRVSGSVHSSEDRTVRPPLSPDDSHRMTDDRPTRLPPADVARAADVDRPRPLEERISQQSVPSLQERLSQPGAPRVENRVTHQPSLEERLSNAPIASDRPLPDVRTSPVEPSRVLPLSDRPAAPADVRLRPPVNDNFARPATPPPRSSGYVAPPRAASVARDDLRGPKDSPPVVRDARDLRARDLSRERSDVRPPYRSDLDRGFSDDRRPDAMDSRRYSPPPPSDVRGRSYYPPRSPPRADVPFEADSDRRFATADQRDSIDRRRDWYGAADDDKSRPPVWRPYDREPQRERYDRDAPPPRSSGWEGRDPERRAPFSSSPVRPIDSSRPLSSRLGDGYLPPVDDRSYPPRDFDRPRYTGPDNDPPFVRGVRPRSPSPPRRGGANSSLDDIRPPLKRAREDPPYSGGGGYYSPRRPSMGDYPPRSAATPPPGSGTSGGFYDSRGGPPPFSSASAGVERDYPLRERSGPGDGGPSYGAAYDRDTRPPRSPPPRMYGRLPYRPDPRDDRRYLPPPPRSG